MKSRIISIMCSGLLLINFGTFAQEKSFSLAQAREYALNNNLELKNAKLGVDYAKKQVLETTGIGLPQINGTIDYQNFIDIPTQLAPANNFDPTAPEDLLIPFQFGLEQSLSAGFTVNQLIFDGTYLVGLKASKVFVDLARKQSNQTEADIKQNVTKAYYAVLVTEENKKLLARNVETLEKIHFETNELFKNGFVESLDIDRLSLSLANLKTQLTNMEDQVGVAHKLLKFHMGMDVSQEISLTDSLSMLTGKLGEIPNSKADVNNRPEYQALMVQGEISELNIKRYTASYLPSLGAFFTHSQNAFDREFNFFDSEIEYFPTTIIGLKLTVPIFSLQNTGLRQQAKIDLQRVRNQQKNLEQLINLEVSQANTNYSNAMKQYRTQQDNLKKAEGIYKTTVIKYNEGVGSSLEMSNAQTELLTTQTNYINALYDLLNAKTDLDKSLGNL